MAPSPVDCLEDVFVVPEGVQKPDPAGVGILRRFFRCADGEMVC